jgi:hypothetical protein
MKFLKTAKVSGRLEPMDGLGGGIGQLQPD